MFRNGLFQEKDQCCLGGLLLVVINLERWANPEKRSLVDEQVAKPPKIVMNILEKELLQSQLTSKELTRLLRTGDGQLSVN